MLNTTNDFDYKVAQKKNQKSGKNMARQMEANINNSFTGGSQSIQMQPSGTNNYSGGNYQKY